jgi:hypothetical protein
LGDVDKEFRVQGSVNTPSASLELGLFPTTLEHCPTEAWDNHEVIGLLFSNSILYLHSQGNRKEKSKINFQENLK